MQIPIMAGTTVKDGTFAASYPINLEPRAIDSGVSKGQLVTTRGATAFADGQGIGRGGIAWNGVLYRVMGSTFVSISETGVVTLIGDVTNDLRPCGFAYSFDRLAIRSAGNLYLYDGMTVAQVTDVDLGTCLDIEWQDGYFVSTDGTSVIVTELLNPAAVDPLKYGSAEEDPDPVVGLMKFREELYVFGRYTIQVMQNVGGIVFPFQTVPGATIPFGAVSAQAKCPVGGASFAFVGGARDEPLGVYIYAGGTAHRISTREIDDMIEAHRFPALIEIECRSFGDERQILVHLQDRTLGIALKTSAEADAGAWFVLHSGDFGRYRPRRAVYVYRRHFVDDTDSNAVGELTIADDKHFGEVAQWQFDSSIAFSNGKGFIAGEVELFGQFPTTPSQVFFSITRDGVQWSREVARRLTGRRDERVLWRPSVRMAVLGGFRWRGHGRVAIARCEMSGEDLAA